MDRDQAVEKLRNTLNVSRETISKLHSYEKLLIQWNPRVNLVAKSTIPDIWVRHFLDSAQIWRYKPKKCTKWLDLGTGAGFPGMVLALIAADDKAGVEFTFAESDQRKAAFLQFTARELGLSPNIAITRIENLTKLGADVISARALAPLNTLLRYAEPHATENTLCIFLKGEKIDKELTEAQEYWKFTAKQSGSISNPTGKIVQIRNIRRAINK